MSEGRYFSLLQSVNIETGDTDVNGGCRKDTILTQKHSPSWVLSSEWGTGNAILMKLLTSLFLKFLHKVKNCIILFFIHWNIPKPGVYTNKINKSSGSKQLVVIKRKFVW